MKREWIKLGSSAALAAVFLVLGAFGAGFAHRDIIFYMGFGYCGASAVTLVRMLRERRRPERYEAARREQQIILQDERRIMLREKSGRAGYIIMWYTLMLIAIVLMFTPAPRWVVWCMWALVIYQYVVGLAAFRYYMRRL